MTDRRDDLGDLLRALDPARTASDTPLNATQLALRDRIVRGSARRSVRRRAGIWWFAAAPIAVMSVIAVAVLWIASPFAAVSTAAAQTPAPLAYSGEGPTMPELIAAAARHASDADAVSRGSSSLGWYLQLQNPGSAAASAVISPQRTTRVWNADGTGSVTVVAGRPYWADGRIDQVPPTLAKPEGAPISAIEFDASQAPAADPAGATPADMVATLTALGLPDGAAAGDVIDYIGIAMDWWQLTPAQHAALLTVLSRANGVDVLGAATGRDGRAVIGIAGASVVHPDIRSTLLVSADTGQIIGVESTRTTDADGVPAGGVVAYTLWGAL